MQRRYLRKHERSQHQGVRRRRHACLYCTAEICKTYSNFQDWKNDLHATHGQCLDPLKREEYAAGFKLDRWERFRDIKGDRTDRAYLRIATLRNHYGRYQAQVLGEPPGPPSTIRLPHIKGTTPDQDVTPTESEWDGSEQEGSGQEEGEITQTEGDEPGSFTQMRSKDSDSGSEDTTTGRDSWRSARDRETVVLSTPRPRGRGKRRQDRGGGGLANRPRMESSSSDRRDETEESRSVAPGTDQGGAAGRAAGPSTPPHRPPPPSVSQHRSPRLTKSAVRDLQSLPLTTKSDRRTAHSRSVSGDEHGRGPSRSSRSSSDHGRSSQGRRSRSREPTPPQLMNFNIDDFTVVSYTTDSFTFASTHPFFPGWVRVVSAPPVVMERATPEWRQKASQAMAFLLGGRGGKHYGSWSGALRQRPECRLDPPDTATGGGIWTARMHNSTVRRVLDGLVSARATGHREPEGMNEILRDIPPRRGVLPVPGPARGSPRADVTFPETGD